MRQFYFSYKQVKHDCSLLRAHTVSCGRFNITVNRDYLHAQNQGKLGCVCLQQFSSIFVSTIQESGTLLRVHALFLNKASGLIYIQFIVKS